MAKKSSKKPAVKKSSQTGGAKQPHANTEASLVAGPRRRKAEQYRRFRYSKRIKHPGPKLPGSWRLLGRSLQLFWRHKRGFATLLLVYFVLSVIFVHGLSSSRQVTNTKTAISQVGGNSHSISGGLTLLASQLGGSGSTSASASTYQSVLLVVFSLAVIWAIRVAYGGKEKVRAKLALYRGLYPLVPFLLVFLVLCIELIPIVIGVTLYTLVASNGLAASGFEQFLWLLGVFMLITWSFYMVTASILALYIVTLPETTPVQALRVAHDLVRHRRWTILRKVIFLPVVLLVFSIISLVPLAGYVPAVGEWIILVYGLALVFVFHSYYYTLYRELL